MQNGSNDTYIKLYDFNEIDYENKFNKVRSIEYVAFLFIIMLILISIFWTLEHFSYLKPGGLNYPAQACQGNS